MSVLIALHYLWITSVSNAQVVLVRHRETGKTFALKVWWVRWDACEGGLCAQAVADSEKGKHVRVGCVHRLWLTVRKGSR